MRIFLSSIGILCLMLFACRNRQHSNTEITPQSVKEPLIDANKKYVKQEIDEIRQYAKRRKWQMTETGTGLFYMVYESGSGAKAKQGQFATLNYKVSLLDGTVCYTSEEKGPREFLIGQDNIETGIHEGVQYLSVGDKAIIILPSHLAHGLLGDENKIPPRSSVIYDVQLLSLR